MIRLLVRTIILSTVVTLSLDSMALAHHSYAATYLMDQKTEIKGEVVVFMYRNPHSVLQVLVTGPDGKAVRWACEWAGTRTLENGGVGAMTVKPGDKVTITGLLGRNPQVPRLFVTSIERPADGWKWAGDSSQ